MRRKWSLLPHLWSETRWIILGIVWLVGLILGYQGFAQFSRDNDLSFSAADIVYRTLQLIVLESGSVTGKINWMLEIARFLLPALTGLTVIQAIMDLFQEQMQWLRLWGMRGHIIVCGFGRKGSYLVNDLLASGQRVVVIDNLPDAGKAAEFRRQGGVLLIGDATNKDLLTSARIQLASHVICLLGQDNLNLQVAFRSYQLSRGRRSGALTCIVHLTSPNWINLVNHNEFAFDHDIPFHIETFNPYARAARFLLHEDANQPCSDLLVIGLGRLGEHLIHQATINWQRLHQEDKLRITVLDQDAAQKINNLLLKNPLLDQACQMLPISVNLSSSESLQCSLMTAATGSTFQRIYICITDSILSLQVYLNLLQIPCLQKTPVWVRLENESGITRVMESAGSDLPSTSQVKPFNLYKCTCSADLVMSGLHELLAHDLHELYRTHGDGRPNGTSSTLPWEKLSTEVKDANRQQVHRIYRLLDSTGYRLSPLQYWEDGMQSFHPEDVERMAQLEHELWRQTKQGDGWRPGKQKDDKKRIHPDLVPWECLPEIEREKNRAMVRELPAILARIGYRIDKTSS